MKRKIYSGIGIVAMVTMLILNVNLVSNKLTGDINLHFLTNIATAQIELPPVEITCNQNPPGQCWAQECHWVPTPFGPIYLSYCPTFTGSMSDQCMDNMPC